MSICTFESFTKDIAQHQLKVLKDDGLYRHLLVKNPDTIEMHFNITTWPGYLCYSGDMGCFVFERTEDMFTFFRKTLGSINPGYWGEKLQAVDRMDGASEWDQEGFEEAVNQVLNDWLESNADRDLDPDFVQEQKDKVEALIDESRQHEAHAVAALNNFEYDQNGVSFEDFWENRCSRATGRYMWCCYAIVHAIHMYDTLKAGEVAA